MKSKQLANVLIKILGLSLFVNAIPPILTVVLTMPRFGWWHVFPSLVVVAIGGYFVRQSQDVAAFLFKDEDE
jgi:hypothetical protein